MKTPRNTQAFPLDSAKGIEEGMTLRDYFAAKALQGIMACNPKIGGDEWTEHDYDILAETFYKMADAMLKQRELGQ